MTHTSEATHEVNWEPPEKQPDALGPIFVSEVRPKMALHKENQCEKQSLYFLYPTGNGKM